MDLKIALLIGFAFLVSVFPFSFVDAAKFQSGVTIRAPPSAGTCADSNNDGVDDNTGAACGSQSGTANATVPTAGTCGLQIVSGVPINYGQLNIGQDSAEQTVTVRNEGTSQTPAKLMIKGGNWVSDAAGNPTISGPEVTRVAIAANMGYENKKSLALGGWELGQISGGQSSSVYFQFRPWVNVPSGSFHQDVTIDLLC